MEGVVLPLLTPICNILRREREKEITQLALHGCQKQNELSGYRHSQSPIDLMLRKGTAFKQSQPYQKLCDDIRRLTDRISRETATIEVSVRPISYTSCPDDHHPHLIDLGLPSGTKWACCNVEADQPYAYGGYYAWGEVDTKTYYDWNTYKHCDGTEETAHDIGLDISGTEYDVAHVKWGGLWVMQNINDFLELIDNCTQEWTTWNGINGKWFKSRNNEARIFFPAAWYYQKDDHIVDVAEGVYWSSSYYTPKPTDAYEFRFGTDFANETWGQIEFGKPVRPVVK